MEVDTEIENLLSKRFEIKFSEKSSKQENGYLNFSYYEIIIQSNKVQDNKIKTNKSIAYPEISTIFIKDHENVILDLSEKNSQIHIQIENPFYLVKCVYVAFKIFFPLEDIFHFVAIKSENPVPIENIKKEVKQMKIPVQSPCNNFTFGIKFYAKYSYLPENEEIIWDIDTVYANKDTRHFFLKDFDHLKPKYLIPVLGAMCYNTYFNEVTLSNVDLTGYEKILERVFKFNKKFKKLYFVNCNLKLSLCSAISTGLEGQKSLICLDLSSNEGIGDKGLEQFVPFLKKSSQYLETFKISKCNLSTISICKIADAFTYNVRGGDSPIQLRVLDLSYNPLREGFKEIFYEFLTKCTHLEDLNLAGMNSSIEQIPIYLMKGAIKIMKYLNLSDNISPTSAQSCTQWSLFFTEIVSLIQINLSNFKYLHCSVTDGLLLGLSDNSSISITGIELHISNSFFNGENFNRFVSNIFKVKCVTLLDLSNNGIELEVLNLLKQLPNFTSLRSLNLNNNFTNLKPKDHSTIILGLTIALQSETVNLQELYIANCNFGNCLSNLISELDCLFSLKILDISGNNIGSIVARTLGRMLTIDKHLQEIIMDNNSVSKEMYEEIIDGLEKNFTLAIFHVPFCDLAKYPAKLVLPIIDKIHKHHIKVNKIFQGISFDDIKAMAFNSIMSQTSENIDKCRSSLQESCNRLKSVNTPNDMLMSKIKETLNKSFETIKTVEKSRNLFSKLNQIYKNNENNPSLSTDIRIGNVIEKICNTVSELINEYMHEIIDELIKEIEVTLPFLSTENTNLNLELLEICKKAITIPNDYIKKLFERFIELNLTKKVYETEMNLTNLLCDRVTDEIILQMNICDLNTNKLFGLSKNFSEAKETSSLSSEECLLRNPISNKDLKARTQVIRSSRMSSMSANKARPISKAIKIHFTEIDISEELNEIEHQSAPPIPDRKKNSDAKILSLSKESPSADNNVINSLKSRRRSAKNVKPKMVIPSIPTVEQCGQISEENWNNFRNSAASDVDKPSEVHKKKPFFNLAKSKKQKNLNIDFDSLGKEDQFSDLEDDKPNVSLEEKFKNPSEGQITVL